MGNADQDCVMGNWSDWSACSRSCGGGQQFAHRQIKQQARGTGSSCGESSLRKVRACAAAPCEVAVDCSWAEWGPMSRCSVTCGGGQMSRHRKISSDAKYGGKACAAGDMVRVAPCNTKPCTLDSTCDWSSWTSWGQCSKPCDG